MENPWGPALHSDASASKRQKMSNYNSDDDDGDEIFTQNPELFDSPLPRAATQPTQIIGKDYQQPISYASPTGFREVEIQVPASSPFTNYQLSSPQPAQPAQAQPNMNGSGIPLQAGGQLPGQSRQPSKPTTTVATMMAPAGTIFRNPSAASHPQKRKLIDLSDDGPEYIASSDDEGAKNANITPTAFQSGTNHGSASKATPNGINAYSAGNAKFNQIISNSVHKTVSKNDPIGTIYDPRKSNTRKPIDLTNLPDDLAPKPRADAMASAYGGRPKPKPTSYQSRPERPKPVEVEDLKMSDITDFTLRGKVERLRIIMPGTSNLMRRDALLQCKGNFDDAAALITKDEPSTNLMSDEDELSLPDPTTTKLVVDKVFSIKDRYGNAATAPARKAVIPNSSQLESSPEVKKPKRRLMQGRKNASPVRASAPKPAVIDVDSDVDMGYSSGMASQSEVDHDLDSRVLKLINKCEPEELADLSNITKEVAEKFLTHRPFKSLDAARDATDTTKTKSGKQSKRVAMGDKIVDAAITTTKSFEAVDTLVNHCLKISKPLQTEMNKWGFNVFGNSKSGELELTSLNEDDDKDSTRDSGIGTPSSMTASQNGDAGEDDVRPINRKDRVKFLQKPCNMSEETVLKDYQVVGLNWLALLYKQGLSCILADEMGLGKTCQVIAFISYLQTIGHSGPHLVVVPGSTLENWLREFQRFSPGLVVEPYHGKLTERVAMGENILAQSDEINVVVTTYDMTVKPSDTSFLKKLNADVCVYDEGHLLKNPMAKKYKALVRIPAKFRLLLTGTPLQNNLQELAALLGFILPSVFKEHFEELEYIFKHRAKTYDSDHSALLSAQRMNRAKEMLRPFVLRRKKFQVLKHLPAKTCRVEYCDMPAVQAKVYAEFEEPALERARLRLEGVVVPAAKTDDNNPFMQLRKAAIHPQLFRRHFNDKKVLEMAAILQRSYDEFDPANYKTEFLHTEMKGMSDYVMHQWCHDYPKIHKFDVADKSWLDSGKVQALIKLLKDYKANGDRVLIFSQFTLVLDILEAVLSTEGIFYSRIDGNTDINQRQTIIDKFRDKEEITAFLLTTKAGGTGLNLMMANKVIIFDASLNPQDDVQAENRAHRVGQTREVEVVRLITRGTIEEQILRLGQSKLALDRGVAGDDDDDKKTNKKAAEEAGEKDFARLLLESKKVKGDTEATT